MFTARRQTILLHNLWRDLYDQQGNDLLPAAQRPADCDVGSCSAGVWLSGASDRETFELDGARSAIGIHAQATIVKGSMNIKWKPSARSATVQADEIKVKALMGTYWMALAMAVGTRLWLGVWSAPNGIWI